MAEINQDEIKIDQPILRPLAALVQAAKTACLTIEKLPASDTTLSVQMQLQQVIETVAVVETDLAKFLESWDRYMAFPTSQSWQILTETVAEIKAKLA